MASLFPATLNQEFGDTDYKRFSDLARRLTGIEFGGTRRCELARAVSLTCAETHLPTVDLLFEKLTAPDRTMVERLISNLTIGETHFFRNEPQFEALQQHILPELIARRRPERRLHIWSAGCSTGEEPYSLAILLTRLLPDIDQWEILILATDINRPALDIAERGVYGPWSFRQVPINLQHTYFIQQGRQCELSPDIRRRVVFTYLNLVESQYPSRATDTTEMDLILCRNVLIYFSEETTQIVVDRLYGALREDGWLIVGHAEPSQRIFHRFATCNFAGAVVYRKTSEPGATVDTLPPTLAHRTAPSCTAASALRAKPGEGRHSPCPDSHARPAGIQVRPTEMPQVRGNTTTSTAEQGQYDLEYERAHAINLLEQAHIDEALKRLEKLAAAPFKDGLAAYWLAKIHAGNDQLPQAERWAQVAVERVPLMAAAHYLHGLLLQEAGEHEAALTALRRCVYADCSHVLGHFTLAGIYARLGQHHRASKELALVTGLLEKRTREEAVADSDGLSVGHLLELATLQVAALPDGHHLYYR